MYAFKDEEKKEPALAPPPSFSNKPLVPDGTATVPFSGQQYGATDDRTYYGISDRIGRNYTPSSSGIAVSNVRNILRGNASGFAMPDFVDSAIVQHRPLNVQAPNHVPAYDSKEMNRSISNGSLQIVHARNQGSKVHVKNASARAKAGQGNQSPTMNHSWSDRSLSNPSLNDLNTSQLLRYQAWQPDALATPRPEPRLFTEMGEIPTNVTTGQPLSRLLHRDPAETKRKSSNNTRGSGGNNNKEDEEDEKDMVVDAAMPFNLTNEAIHQQVEYSSTTYGRYQESLSALIRKEKNQLHVMADTQLRRTWMGRALSMVPTSTVQDEQIILKCISELDRLHWTGNATSRIQYELKHAHSLQRMNIDRTALALPEMVWCDHTYTNDKWVLLRQTGIRHVVLVVSHELMDSHLHTIHSLALKVQEAWDAVHHQPVSTLMEDVVVEDTLPLTSSGSTTTKENITKDGTLADLSPQKSKTMAAHPENVGPGGGNNNGGNNGSVRGGARGGASGGATASFSCTSLKTFDQSLPLTLKDFHKCVQTQAQMIRDQLQRGWLSYGQERFAIDAQVSPTATELANDTTGILQAQMDRLELANEQRKLDPRNGGTGMMSSSSMGGGGSGAGGSGGSTLKKKKNKKKSSPMIESINDLRRRYEALDEESQEGDELLGFVNQSGGTSGGRSGGRTTKGQELEQWVEKLPDLSQGLGERGGNGGGGSGGNRSTQPRPKDTMGQVMQMTVSSARLRCTLKLYEGPFKVHSCSHCVTSKSHSTWSLSSFLLLLLLLLLLSCRTLSWNTRTWWGGRRRCKGR